jgi:hypothetical protein
MKINSGITEDIASVAYGGGRFVAVSRRGTTLYSADASAWTIKTREPAISLSTVTFCKDRFLATGFRGALLSSPDGVTWDSLASGTTDPLSSAAYGDGRFVVLLDNTISMGLIPASVISSPDGATWTPETLNTLWGLSAVAFGPGASAAEPGMFAIAGYYGTILTSKAGGVAAADPSGEMQVRRGAGGVTLAKNRITVTFNDAAGNVPGRGRANVSVFNVNGRRLYSTITPVMDGVAAISSAGFPFGRYFVTATRGNGTSLLSGFVLMR